MTNNHDPEKLIVNLSAAVPDTVLPEFENLPADVPAYFCSPRAQLEQILRNMATRVSEHWNGRLIVTALTNLLAGQSPVETILREYKLTAAHLLAMPLIVHVFPRLIDHEIGSIQPVSKDDGTGKVFTLQPVQARRESANDQAPDQMVLTFELIAQAIKTYSKQLTSSWSLKELGEINPNDLLTILGGVSREIALEHNYHTLNTLFDASVVEWNSDLESGIEFAEQSIFSSVFGNGTHLILGAKAKQWLEENNLLETTQDLQNRSVSPYSAHRYEGFVEMDVRLKKMPEIKLFWTPLWVAEKAHRSLLIRRGKNWADTPAVWSPGLLRVEREITNGVDRCQMVMEQSCQVINREQIRGIWLL